MISRVISDPRELVCEAFTEVRHLSRWWGPEGFTTTTRAFEFRVGGEWDFVMHGADGTDYQEWISWTEIAPPERIALLHGESRGDPNASESVLTFAPYDAATRVEMRTVFTTKELRAEGVEESRALGGGQNARSPRADLIWPNTGSMMCLRAAYSNLPVAVRNLCRICSLMLASAGGAPSTNGAGASLCFCRPVAMCGSIPIRPSSSTASSLK